MPGPSLHSIPTSVPVSISHWISEQQHRSNLTVTPIGFSDSREWLFDGGMLRHRSGRFFTIEGLRAGSNFWGGQQVEQPIINQPEIGILGYLLQVRDGQVHFLVQAKSEPGNINTVQLAPTFQATVSNYTCAHKGDQPHFAEYFLHKGKGSVVLDQLQSEQGSRFLRKNNRNMVVMLAEGDEIAHDERFRWIPARELCRLLRFDNVVNTDSRSVLASMQWELLKQGHLFDRFDNEHSIGAMLNDSYVSETATLEEAYTWLHQLRAGHRLTTEQLPLSALKGWEVTGCSIKNGHENVFSVIQVAVHAEDREVSDWDQPLLTNTSRGLVGMLCQRRNGVLQFLIQAIAEPGIRDGIELTASVQTSAMDRVTEAEQPFVPLVMKCEGQLLWESVYSEEGGRFYQDENLYRLVMLPESFSLTLPENYRWMTLRQVRCLLSRANIFTNEARSLFATLTLWL